jgi:hypothetical protein
MLNFAVGWQSITHVLLINGWQAVRKGTLTVYTDTISFMTLQNEYAEIPIPHVYGVKNGGPNGGPDACLYNQGQGCAWPDNHQTV